MNDFSVGYNAIDKSNILNIHKCLMTTEQYKIVVRLIRQVLIGVLCFSRSLATICVSLNNKPLMVRPTLIDLNPVELNYYPFMISLGKCS